MSSSAEEYAGVELTYSTLVGGRAYHKKLSFSTSHDFTEYKAASAKLKEHLARIMLAYDAGRPLPDGGLESWLPLVVDFTVKYGNPRVPLGIRNAVHDTQRCLGLPLTDFGPDTGGYFQRGLIIGK